MARICYVPRKFHGGSEGIILTANTIIAEYQRMGYKLTLRQLYYRFIARAAFPNTEQSYKRLGSIINDARLAGRVDWDAIEDRTRNLRGVQHWRNPSSIVEAAASSYRIDKWSDQPKRVEVWVEKEALAAIIERAAERNDVDWLACRGYMSQSEMHDAALRLNRYMRRGQEVTIIHLGDHDPSGIDMTRDIGDRLRDFCQYHALDAPEVNRIALNIAQVERYNPPPNPAKMTDSRFGGYASRFGDESWELDALDPVTLGELITSTIQSYRDDALYQRAELRELRERAHLTLSSENWADVSEQLEADYPDRYRELTAGTSEEEEDSEEEDEG